MLNSETNTPAMEREILDAAVDSFGNVPMSADFEHGQVVAYRLGLRRSILRRGLRMRVGS